MRMSCVRWMCILAALGLSSIARAETPWIAAVGKETLVCVSRAADAQVRSAAQQVLAAVQTVQPKATMQDPEQLAFDYDALGTHHVIVVGQWEDNLVMRMTWGYWASSKARRDWQAKGDARARELMNLWEKYIPPQTWRDKHEFFAFGYGEFDGPDVGYIQTVRNPFPILLRTAPGQTQYDTSRIRLNDHYPSNQMYFMVHLTGTGPAGVTKAVNAFLGTGLLNGVIPGAATSEITAWNLEGLGPKELATHMLPWFPTTGLPKGIRYLGQQMPGSHLYGGFTEAAGQRPLRCWRLKYAEPSGFVFYDSYPTNRASGNELFIAEMSDAAAAGEAAKSVRSVIGRESAVTGTWQFGGHTYGLYADGVKNRMTWEQAKVFCEQHGGHLVTLSSENEEQALASALLKYKTSTVYIGMSGDWRTKQFAWVTGEPVTYRGWPIQGGKEVFGKNIDDLPPGRYPVQIVQVPANKESKMAAKGKLDAGWFISDADRQTDNSYFVCEWEGPRPPYKPTQRVATRDQFVVLQSFDLEDPAGEALLLKAVTK